jgi:hypothetical protein
MKTLKNSPCPQTSFEQVVDRIFASGKITRSDENYFLRVLLAERSLNETELLQINTVLQRLQMGLLKVVD